MWRLLDRIAAYFHSLSQGEERLHWLLVAVVVFLLGFTWGSREPSNATIENEVSQSRATVDHRDGWVSLDLWGTERLVRCRFPRCGAP